MKVQAFPVKSQIQKKSYLKSMQEYLEMYQSSLENPSSFWLEAARNLDWFHFPSRGLEGDFTGVDYSWFNGGKLNISYNCLDRHLETKREKT